MDRFEWSDGVILANEKINIQQKGVRLYDGEEKTAFDSGTLTLTTHRLLWKDSGDQRCILALPLSLVIYLEEQPSGIGRSAKIVMHLQEAPPGGQPGPVQHSRNVYIKLAFKEAGETEFYRRLSEELSHRRWEHIPKTNTVQSAKGGQRHAGIVGIERGIFEKHKATDQHISQAFQDLSKLMEKAKEMVTISKNISQRIREKQGDITEDETIKFKSYLLSLGIPDPVTRDTHGSGDRYFLELAKQVTAMLETPLKECGGMMTLTDVYCRVNRARGMELLSPEDLVNACEVLAAIKSPIRLRIFDSGVMVLQLETHSEAEVISNTSQTVSEKESLTAEELSKVVGVSVILAKESLLCTEKAGKICRDESVEGLRFYPNIFLTKSL